jgi:hypothetical protein
MLKASRAHTANITRGWLTANLKNHWSKDILPPSSQNCNPFAFLCGAKFRESAIHAFRSPLPPSRSWPQMLWPTLTGRSSFMPASSFGLGLRLLWSPLGFLLTKYVFYMHTLWYILTLKFSSKYIDPNYLFYWFECFHMICPNLSSAPCICRILILLQKENKNSSINTYSLILTFIQYMLCFRSLEPMYRGMTPHIFVHLVL